jgi:acetylglutamate kinase
VTRIVVKVGGAVAARSAEAVLELARNHEVCVVHGAGPQISAEMERAGIAVEFVGGRRVTTPEGIEIVRSSLAAVNATLCEAIGERALGLLGSEIGLAATRVLELGLVGKVAPTELPAVDRALADGRIPVLAPLGVDAGGNVLNVNADDAAAAIATGAHADKLVFLTDVEGFMVDGVVVDSLDVPTAESLFSGGTLDPTILPKLGAAIAAARTGVPAFIGRTEVIAA